MEEFFELRVKEEMAGSFFTPGEGRRLGTSIRKVILRGDDPRLAAIGALQNQLRKQNSSVFFGWDIQRRYTQQELDSASLFRLIITRAFEPYGEECGTTYDDTRACSKCGSGAVQLNELAIDPARITHVDFAQTIASEIVVSSPLADVLRKETLSGVELETVRGCRSRRRLPFWQPIFTNLIDVSPPTRVGNGPFANAVVPQGSCENGDLLGLNLISEVSVKGPAEVDMLQTRQYIGVRRGVLRPRRLLLVSQRVRAVLERESITGYVLEVAHVVA